MSFSLSKQTNKHLGARPTRIENATKFNNKQTFRVEFTLTKLQEDYPGKSKLETNYSCSQNYKTSKEEQLNIIFSRSDKVSQTNQNAKALQKMSKLKQVQAVQLYGPFSNRFGQFLLSP